MSADDSGLPLSFAQEQLWFLDQLRSGASSEYLMCEAFRIRGPLDTRVLEAAFTEISERHEVLRTRYGTAGGAGAQFVDEPGPVRLARVDLTGTAPADREARVRELHAAELRTPIDLRDRAPWRLTLVRFAEEDAALLVTVHHIAFDGWSWGVLARELHELCTAFAAGRPSPLEPVPVQYADFAQWQRDTWAAAPERAGRRRGYWRERLAGLEPLELPADRRRPAQWDPAGDSVPFTVPAELAGRLAVVGRDAGATPFMVHLAAFQLLLARWSGRTDVAVGVSVSDRNEVELEPLVGLFLNTVVMRTDLSGRCSFLDLLARVRETTLDAYEHQDVPFGWVVADLAPERDPSRNPVFQVGFALHNAERRPLRLPGLDVAKVEPATDHSAFDLSLHLSELPDGSMAARLIFPTALFDRARIERMAASLLRLLTSIAEHPDIPAHALETVPVTELAAFERWNRTETERPRQSLAELFFAQALATPEAVAVVSGARVTGYAELADRVRRLAGLLRSRGVGPESAVGVALHRGTDLVATVLAVLTAGGVYVPLAPEHPAERLAHLVTDAEVTLLVTEEALSGRLPAHPNTLVLDAVRPGEDGEAPPLEPAGAVGTQAAYVMYTSGSTGRPKGVVVPEAAIRNRVLWSVERFGLGPGDRVLQKTTIGFDAAVWEFLSPLVCGAAVVTGPRDAHRDPAVMVRALVDHRVTVLQGVPSMLRLLLEEPALADCAALRLLCSAGEPLPAELADRLRRTLDAEVVNTYGPTECAVDSTAWHFDPDEPGDLVPIGLPLPNVRTYVVDAEGLPVPVGVTGELYVGGIGLARGYAGRGDLTADRFVPDPDATVPGARRYRTGDLVRRRADGALEYVGRVDDQVKIGGVRIEPGEIEVLLAAHPSVAAAAVAVHRSAAGDARLTAYAVPAAGERIDPEALRVHLAAALPEAMLPSAFVGLAELPLTPNGKVDRRRLPAATEPDQPAEEARQAPRTAAEETVAELMAEILGVERVGAHDDFFLLGGHSLLAIRLVLRLRRAFGSELTVGELFQARTVAALAARVTEAGAGSRTALDGDPDADPDAVRPAGRDRPLPLSFGQQRMWFLDQLEPGTHEYVVPLALRLTGPLETGALRHALDALSERHEVLRTRYRSEGGEPVQVVDPAGPVDFTLTDLTGAPDAEHRARALVDGLARQPFDLEHGHPLRASLIRTGPEDHLLVLTLHHIAFDAWSTNVYLRDLDLSYRAFAAGEPSPHAPQPVRYADFAVWQREQQRAGRLDHQLAYWRDRLDGLTPVELPTDRVRSAVRDARGDNIVVEVTPEVARAVAELAGRHGATPFMVMLAAFQVLLRRWTGRDDLAVGTPVAGRTRQETEDMVGFFTNNLVIRSDLGGNPVFGELLEQVRGTVLDAFAHQDVPFEHLVDALQPERDLSRNPLFQIMFEHQHLAGVPDRLGAVAVEPVRAGLETAKFDLTVTVKERGGRMYCWFEYATALFDRETVERMAGHYLTLIAGVTDAPGARIGDLDMLTGDERHRALTAWADPGSERTTVLDPAEEHGLCVPELFARQVRRAPDAIAVVFGDQQVSYAELDARSARFAAHLRSLGVTAETIVGSCLERGVEAVVVLLAVLKAGGVYVPFDPGHPAERLQLMLADAGPELVVTTRAFADRLTGAHRVVLADADADARDESGLAPGGPAPVPTRPHNLAYVIYTSGSTGRPKGVMIEHRSYAHHCRVIADAYGIAPGERVALLSALTFDVAMDQIAATLVAGATVVVADPVFWTPDELPARLAEHGVTVLEITPSYYRAVLESPHLPLLDSLKLMNVGSDVVTGLDARRWTETGLPARFLCNYGPTEATVTCLLHPVPETPAEGDAAGALPLGRPVPGTRAYILDADLRPVPVGVPGELYLGGVRLARGYHRRPDLTAERFVPDPFATEPGRRLYRTGDLTRHRPDGTIEFLGRIDHQVKVRGLRIELGEIEAALARHPALQEAVVTAPRTAPGERRLAAYLVARPDSPMPGVAELRGHLGALLPEYMIPSVWVPLDAFPLTASKKIDRNALPDASAAPAGGAREHLAPRDPAEQAVAAIWSEVLGLERIGAQDDFFALGGHSLLATRVLARLRETFAVELPLRLLFEATTVARLSEAVSEAVEADVAALSDQEVAGLLAEEGLR
ncbi:amino acid adenylation domain-containing protein [Streptomyces phaeoluteigriseus]|uniref:Amino acid adenylation domain-containing protein n=1 Tax=Streptomyces phaeoluteigriseus TaxID=114686 RepID=A0ABY4ZG93_9ACTN|nr:non-ribosomal peptide synthetase [Streptomyces phaeoluteigriseus]USQ87996.1 amino acid adenylation domain-containing protein [Streptomyces phaeoluteigriseus]